MTRIIDAGAGLIVGARGTVPKTIDCETEQMRHSLTGRFRSQLCSPFQPAFRRILPLELDCP